MNAIRFYDSAYNRNLINDLFGGFNMNENRESRDCGCIPANIAETGKDFRIEMMVPGFRKEDISISVQKNVLTVKSEGSKNGNEEVRYLSREFGVHPFERSFILSKHVDADAITAGFDNGILQIVLPKREEVVEKVPVQIEIQ